VPVGVLGKHVIIRVLDHARPVAHITKSGDDLVDIAEILFDRNIVPVGFEYPIVMSFEQDLASFGADRLEMARGDAFSGNAGLLAMIEFGEYRIEGGSRVFDEIVGARPIQQAAALIEVVGARLGSDQPLAAVQEMIPGRARDSLLSYIAAQAARLPMPLKPLDDLGALAVSDKWPVDVADEADIDLAARVGNREKNSLGSRRAASRRLGYVHILRTDNWRRRSAAGCTQIRIEPSE